MVKVILKGSQQCQWNIGGTMKPGGTIIDIAEENIKKHSDVVLKIIEEKNIEVPIEITYPVPKDGEPIAEKKEEVKKENPKEPIKEELKYTKESLQEIADKKGISGLRKIGKKFNVTFRSITEGIKEILEAQK